MKILRCQEAKVFRSSDRADGVCDKEIEQQVGAAAKVMGAMRKEVLER